MTKEEYETKVRGFLGRLADNSKDPLKTLVIMDEFLKVIQEKVMGDMFPTEKGFTK